MAMSHIQTILERTIQYKMYEYQMRLVVLPTIYNIVDRVLWLHNSK